MPIDAVLGIKLYSAAIGQPDWNSVLVRYFYVRVVVSSETGEVAVGVVLNYVAIWTLSAFATDKLAFGSITIDAIGVIGPVYSFNLPCTILISRREYEPRALFFVDYLLVFRG